MNEEMRAFALRQAEEARDIVAEELFRRATRVDLDVVDNEYKNVSFYFDFIGAEVGCKWNRDGRFSNPDTVYEIMLRLLYASEDAPKPVAEKSEPAKSEPLGFVWGAESDDEEAEEEKTVNEWSGPEFKL